MTFALLGKGCASAEYPESSLSDETCCDSETFTGEVAQPVRNSAVSMSEVCFIVDVQTSNENKISDAYRERALLGDEMV